jgi:hypothetical protein
MASKKKTNGTDEKRKRPAWAGPGPDIGPVAQAEEIAKLATKYAGLLRSIDGAKYAWHGRPALEARIKKAYNAIRPHWSEADIIGQIFGTLNALGRLHKGAADIGADGVQYSDEWAAAYVRDSLDLILGDAAADRQGNANNVTDATILAALRTWKRDKGAPKQEHRGAGDKWEATLALLNACGLKQGVSAEAIERSFMRWLPKKQRSRITDKRKR